MVARSRTPMRLGKPPTGFRKRKVARCSQQQLASGKLGSLSQEADRLTQEERAQVDRINKFASQGGVDPEPR